MIQKFSRQVKGNSCCQGLEASPLPCLGGQGGSLHVDRKGSRLLSAPVDGVHRSVSQDVFLPPLHDTFKPLRPHKSVESVLRSPFGYNKIRLQRIDIFVQRRLAMASNGLQAVLDVVEHAFEMVFFPWKNFVVHTNRNHPDPSLISPPHSSPRPGCSTIP